MRKGEQKVVVKSGVLQAALWIHSPAFTLSRCILFGNLLNLCEPLSLKCNKGMLKGFHNIVVRIKLVNGIHVWGIKSTLQVFDFYRYDFSHYDCYYCQHHFIDGGLVM